MKTLFSILALFSQAFAVVIVPSNMIQKFFIYDVDGIGCIATPQEFKEFLKLKLPNQCTYGATIKQNFHEYVIKSFNLDSTETGALYDLLNKEISDPLMLIPFDSVLSMLRAQ